MMFTIPVDPRKADALCSEYGLIVTAAEWPRAAIVFARVRVQDEPGRPTAEMAKSGLLSAAEFARLGIHGLRSRTTVRRYHMAWSNAISEGLAQPVALGDEVELPDAEWDDYYSPVDPEAEQCYVPATDIYDEAFEDDEDEGELGNCPPLASDLDAGEQTNVRPVSPRPARPPATPLPPPSPEHANANAINWVQVQLSNAMNAAETAARGCAQVTKWDGSNKLALKRIARTRKLLKDIERIVRKADE